MQYLIAAAASAWFLLFVTLEHRAGGPMRYAWRPLGAIPFVVLAALAWDERFSNDALMIAVFTILAVSSVELVARWRRRRSTQQR